ncbi:MAG: glycosyl transferase, family 51 [Frankiales bacterium]|nr:glycosyl transferase, family 51 [Frankiales bacterium]
MTTPSPSRKPLPGTGTSTATGKKSWITRRPRKVLAPKTGWRHAVPRLRTTLWVLFGLVLVGVAGFAILYSSVQIPGVNPSATAQTTIIYYSDGKTELGRVGEANREVVPDKLIPKHVKAAVIAAEDRNFYTEPGISVPGILRAAIVNLTGGSKQGGSTITQQYVKNAYLTQERTYTRKLKEAVIAMKISKTKTKDQILTDYLNTIWFGRGASGIQAASKAYFGTTVDKLTVAQAAMLAAIIQQPANLDPATHKDALVGRWHYVVNGMVTDGDLTQAEADKLRFPRSITRKSNSTAATGPARFIQDAVLAELEKDGIAGEQVQTEGLRVVTTIDKAGQTAAEAAETDVVLAATKGAKKKPVSALVSIEPGTGRIKAMYGGQDFGNGGCDADTANCTNLATQIKRPPGSTFKSFVLSTYLTQGHSVLDRFNGPNETKLADGTPVHNDAEGETCSNCTLLEALARSINTIYEPLAELVGPKAVADQAYALGIPQDTVQLDDNGFTGPSIALGTYDVHVIDMARAYATFAANGVRADPFLVETVKDARGKTLYKAAPKTDEVLDTGVAADVTAALQAVVTSGTGTAAKLAGGRPAAGKTGTTGGSKDAWFVGFTPQLATAVGVGNIDNTTTIGQLPNYPKGLYGGTLPAMTFKAYMDGALQGQPIMNFPAPTKQTPSDLPSPTTTTSSLTPSPTVTTSAPPTSASPTLTPTVTPTVSTSASETVTLPPSPSAPLPSGTATPANSAAAAGATPAPRRVG